MPITPFVRVRAFNHLLGECGISIFGTAALQNAIGAGFRSRSTVRRCCFRRRTPRCARSSRQWFQAEAIRPEARAEFDDSALLKAFGEAGLGLFPAPAVIEREVERRYGVRVVGRPESVKTQFFAISTERKLRHPAVKAITEAAKGALFGEAR